MYWATLLRSICTLSCCLVVLGLGGGCSNSGKTRAERPSLLSGMVGAPPFRSPASWAYHPPDAGKATAVVKTDDGQLVITERGERWLVDASSKTAEVAAMLAPEPLQGVLRLPDGWLFVGNSGATYESRGALDDFARSTAPSFNLARVAVSRRSLLGVTTTGKAVLSEDLGFGWRELDVPGRSVDVALLRSGDGLLLQVPERLLTTADGGKTWKPVDEPAFGAVALHPREREIVVEGVLGGRSWSPGTGANWSRNKRAFRLAVPSFEVELRPSAEAISRGHAVLTSSGYFEVVPAGRNWVLRFGPPEGKLSERPIEPGIRCAQLRIFGFADQLYLLCGEQGDSSVEADVYRSTDGGKSFRRESYSTRASFEDVAGAVLADGSLVLSGVCAPDEARAGCPPIGVYRRTAAGDAGAASLTRLSVPSLSGLPLGVGRSGDGKLLLLVGQRTKGGSLAVFASERGEGEFQVEEVRELVVGDERRFDRGQTLRVTEISPGPDGNTAIVIANQSRREHAVIVVDGAGRPLGVGQAPNRGALIGAAGAFTLAIHPQSGQAWESLDGGVSWAFLGGTPAALCTGEADCEAALHCWPGGCVVGQQLSRIGWRGQREAGTQPLTPKADAVSLTEQHRTPLSCQLDTEADWRTLRGLRAPDASQAELGEVAWFAFDVDFGNASVSMQEAVRNDTKVETVPLFEAASKPGSYALYASLQIEGIAALRQSAGSTEVAWRNLFEARRTNRRALPRAARVSQRPTRFATQLAQPGLLSISEGGLFVRSEEADKDAPTRFVPVTGAGGGISEVAPLSFAQNRGRPEMIRAQETSIAITIVEEGAAIIRHRHVGGSWENSAMTLGLLDPGAFEIRQAFDLAYLGRTPGLHLMFLDGESPVASWFPFQATDLPLGAPHQGPTQAALAAQPETCNAQERASTPRLVTPAERGTRHPVMITRTTEPLPPLLTEDAVLFGAKQAPCVARFAASQPGDAQRSEEYSALVVPDPGRVSWLFRRVPASEEFDVRPMRCDYDASLDVPLELLTSSGR